MKIVYKDKKIERLCNDEEYMIKKLGNQVSKKLIDTLNFIEAAPNFHILLLHTPFHLHVLKGNLNGIYSIYLGKNTGFRLLLLPLDYEEKFVKIESLDMFKEIKETEILEVSKHYE